MPTFWTPSVLDELVAPGLSGFTEAVVPSLESSFPEAEHWLTDHFLSSAVGTTFKTPMRQLVLGYLRRTHHAFRAYHEARISTQQFFAASLPGSPKVSRYYDAVALWEVYVLQNQMATELYNKFGFVDPAFTQQDGSAEQRLYDMGNRVKHPFGLQSGAPLPLWLSNNGLHSFDQTITYVEASDVLRAMSQVADKLKNPETLR
jgi:hypothetical protein